jgi:hypothetical protein
MVAIPTSQERAANAEKGADHGHHLDVAHAHPFASANAFVKLGESPEHKAAQSGAQQAVEEPEQMRGWHAMKESFAQ